MKLELKDIEKIELELSNICNLKCPLCLLQNKTFSNVFKPHFRDINDLIKQLDLFENLKIINLAGDASEPTLYPNLFQLIDYLHKRNIIIQLFTNATLYDEQYWYNLGHQVLNKNDICIFTICGTTQELHERYRVGSKLDVILRNSQAFINENGNDCMQYIKFEYNKYDADIALKTILPKYSNYYVMGTDPIFERFHLTENDDNNGILSVKNIETEYKLRSIIAKNKKNKCIECQSFKYKAVRIDNFGVVSPCICYRLYNNESFIKNGILDYTDILNNKFGFCYECDKDMIRYFLHNKINAFYMCFKDD